MAEYLPRILIPANRLKSLTDGLFAIVRTIMVVKIQRPIGPIHNADLFVIPVLFVAGRKT
ncbi:MAG: hypothetical protein Q4P17_03595 [Methanobacterium sp.]|nr:hypothetical protein [Methanobacterium sp.]